MLHHGLWTLWYLFWMAFVTVAFLAPVTMLGWWLLGLGRRAYARVDEADQR